MFTNGFEHIAKLYIPSTTDVSQQLTQAQADVHVKKALRFFADRFGGATAQRCVGAWVAENGDLIEEDVTIVFSFAKSLAIEDRKAIYSFAESLRNELSQEAIACEIDGKLYFV